MAGERWDREADDLIREVVLELFDVELPSLQYVDVVPDPAYL